MTDVLVTSRQSCTMETDVAVLAERRAKLAKLREEHFVLDRDITSAPDITSVDEYRTKFNAGMKQLAQQGETTRAIEEHKIFFAHGKKNVNPSQSDLDFNPLIDLARQRKTRSAKSDGGLDNEDFDHLSHPSDETLENIEVDLVDGNGVKNSTNDFDQEKLIVGREKRSKFYRDGEYISPSPSEDPGYQSAAHSPTESLKRGKEDTVTPTQNQLLNIEPAVDPLSVSLPETFLKTVKNDLSQSIKSTISTKSKVHYDPRIFSAKKRKKSMDPEKEYFKNMSKFYGEMNTKYPEYEDAKNASKLSGGDPTSSNLPQNVVTDSGEVLETIDLTDPVHVSSADSYSLADTVSIKTEVTDVGPGPEPRRSNLRSLGESVILSVSGRVRERLPARRQEAPWAGRSVSPPQQDCKLCKHRRGTSCCSLIGLLLIDLVTLIILFYGYSTLRQFQEGERDRKIVTLTNIFYITRHRANVGTKTGTPGDLPVPWWSRRQAGNTQS